MEARNSPATARNRADRLSWYRFGVDILSSILSLGGAFSPEQISPTAASRRFLSRFEERYGSHPNFFEGSVLQALNHAKRNYKFLFVYLHSDHHSATPHFCRTTLGATNLIEFLNDNFICWAGSVSDSEAFGTANALRVSSFPYVALLTQNTDRGAAILQSHEGPITADELITQLVAAMEENGNVLQQERQRREEQMQNRRLIEEQDKAFLESLQADQEKEKKKREEEEKLRREEEESQLQAALKFEEEERHRINEEKKQQQKLADIEKKKQSLLPEPAEGEKEVTTIAIRLPDGSRLSRRFWLNENISAVYNFLEANNKAEPGTYDLVTSYPRQIYSNKAQTFQEAKLFPQALLLIQERAQS